MRRASVCAASVALTLIFAVQAAGVVLYRAVDLGTLSEEPTPTTATAINDLGQVVGNTASRAFRTAPNDVIRPTCDLGTLGGDTSYAYGINNLGQVVGSSTGTDSSTGRIFSHAFRTGPNEPIYPSSDMGALWTDSSDARGINDRGEVVGTSIVAGHTVHAFRTGPNAPIDLTSDLGTLGGILSTAHGINDAGQVVGYSDRADGYMHAYRTAPGGAIKVDSDLGTLGGGSSVGVAVNSSGQVVGSSTYSFGLGMSHIFRTGPDMPIVPVADDLGVAGGEGSPTVYGMNDRGDVVGSFYVEDESSGAFVILGSTAYNLNDVVEGGLDFTDARDINNAGQIVANTRDGHAYRLDPVPEPSAFVRLGMGAIGLLACTWRWRKRAA